MKRENLIKVCLGVIVVTLFSFSDWSFADGDTEDLLETVWDLLYMAIGILSWVWVFFAKWAWEFLTNKWIYGEVIWLDVVLWQYRNVVKNIANFGLWFYFIYEVWKWVLSLNGVEKIKDKLVWLLVAWVWIQASWFMTAVVIDVSTISLSAVWALPSMVISQSSDIKDSFDLTVGDMFEKGKKLGDEIPWGKQFALFLPNMGESTIISRTDLKNEKSLKKKEFFDKLLPSANSVAGPLYYLWFSILKTPTLVSPNGTSEKQWKSTIFNMLLQWWTTIIFAIEMLVLLIFSVMRVAYMWVFIVLSPLVVLLKCIEKASDKSKWFMGDFMKSIKEQFDFKPFLWNAFKPTLIVLWFSLSIIFVSLISSTIIKEWQNFDMWWFETSNQENGSQGGAWQWDLKYTTTIDWETAWVLIRTWWKRLFEFILCIITVILVYRVIKFAVNMWGWEKDFVTKNLSKLQNNITEDLTSLPLMPVAGWDEKTWKPKTRFLSAGKVLGIDKEGNIDINNSIIWRELDHYQKKVNAETESQNAIINSLFGDNTWYLSSDEMTNIENAWKSRIPSIDVLTDKKKVIDALEKPDENGNKKWKWMTLNPDTAKNDKFWIKQFWDWLTSMKGKTVTWTSNNEAWNSMIQAWNSSQITDIEKRIKEIFEWHADRVKAYADFFGLSLASNDWDHLKSADISK